jgi:hypothetical protein
LPERADAESRPHLRPWIFLVLPVIAQAHTGETCRDHGDSMLRREKNTAISAALTTDPVKLRVALLAADPPDHAKPACFQKTAH